MTFRERTLGIFRRESVDNIVFQPRLEHWYNVNRQNATLPERYAGMSLMQLYDDLGCSMRTYDYTYLALNAVDDPSVVVHKENVGDDVEVTRWVTPVGTIHNRVTLKPGWHIDEFPVKTPDDLRVMEYILQGRRWEFDAAAYAEADKQLGDRAAPMLCIPRINVMRISIEMMGFENTLYTLADDPAGMEGLIHAIDEGDRQLVECVAASPFEIINFGDNLDQHICSPTLFERYMLPVYQWRTEAFRQKGKYTHSHWDGSVKLLLRYAQQTGLDGIEALTPLPQGDVTVEEIKAGIGDMVLLDGVPMLHFMPDMPIGELDRMTHQVIETFRPNLILGVSDELSPVCDIERVRRVAEIVESCGRPAKEQS